MAESTDTSQSMSPVDWASSVPARGRGSMGVYTQQCLLPANSRDAAPKTKQAQINLYVKQMTSLRPRTRSTRSRPTGSPTS
ncbi:hypothetical protein ACH4Y0_00525 [Streptomyces sp. NPDC020707]|uniref:hypothetical protein n=1 Tax=Streptomyces TaxID=1883 RepID=UPI0028D6B0AC|nr:hypothetical protein [Streptomyces sp. DSM 40484]